MEELSLGSNDSKIEYRHIKMQKKKIIESHRNTSTITIFPATHHVIMAFKPFCPKENHANSRSTITTSGHPTVGSRSSPSPFLTVDIP